MSTFNGRSYSFQMLIKVNVPFSKKVPDFPPFVAHQNSSPWATILFFFLQKIILSYDKHESIDILAILADNSLTIICSMYILGGALHFINKDVKFLTP